MSPIERKLEKSAFSIATKEKWFLFNCLWLTVWVFSSCSASTNIQFLFLLFRFLDIGLPLSQHWQYLLRILLRQLLPVKEKKNLCTTIMGDCNRQKLTSLVRFLWWSGAVEHPECKSEWQNAYKLPKGQFSVAPMVLDRT